MLYQNRQWIEDIDHILNGFLELQSLENKSVLITGASGLICSSVVDMLFRYNDFHDARIQIYAAGRSWLSMQHRFGKMMERADFHYVPYDATQKELHFDFHSDYIIHGAGNAFPKRVMTEPVETMVGNFLGIKNLLDYAKETAAKRVLYISSSEVYGKKNQGHPYCEEEYGYVDLLNPRNSYSVGKRAAETLCISYEAEHGVETVIARPGHIYGPTASENDTRVSSQWPYAVARGEDIIMKSDGAQVRSYCYCLDCASAILKILLKGENKQAYNISNPDSIISIKQMAVILAECGHVELKIEIPTSSERRAFSPMNNSSLNSEKLLNLGWSGCFNAEEGFGHTLSITKDCLSKDSGT